MEWPSIEAYSDLLLHLWYVPLPSDICPNIRLHLNRHYLVSNRVFTQHHRWTCSDPSYKLRRNQSPISHSVHSCDVSWIWRTTCTLSLLWGDSLDRQSRNHHPTPPVPGRYRDLHSQIDGFDNTGEKHSRLIGKVNRIDSNCCGRRWAQLWRQSYFGLPTPRVITSGESQLVKLFTEDGPSHACADHTSLVEQLEREVRNRSIAG